MADGNVPFRIRRSADVALMGLGRIIHDHVHAAPLADQQIGPVAEDQGRKVRAGPRGQIGRHVAAEAGAQSPGRPHPGLGGGGVVAQVV